MDSLPDELLLKIFHFLDKRDLSKCSQVNRKFNRIAHTDDLWQTFSLTDIQKPKWCSSTLISVESTNFLITKRFSPNITRVDLSKMCFSFQTLNALFKHCKFIKSLSINFKYLQLRGGGPLSFLNNLVEQTQNSEWPTNRLEKLYLKNVCDMKIRRLNNQHPTTSSYDLIEMEIIKLIRILFKQNAQSLKVLGLKCVDPNVICSCLNNDLLSLEILLLNNVSDTDGVLQEIASFHALKQLKCLELNKCSEFKGDGLQEILEQCSNLETLQIGKQIYPAQSELYEINWSLLKNKIRELSITTKFSTIDAYDMNNHSNSSSNSNDYSFIKQVFSTPSSSRNTATNSIDLYSNTIFNYLNDSNNKLEYLALADFTLRFPDSPHSSSHQSLPNLNHNKQSIDSSTSNLKYLHLRNIRNTKYLTEYQLSSLKSFLCMQHNLHTLDLLGLHLNTDVICSIAQNLNNLR